MTTLRTTETTGATGETFAHPQDWSARWESIAMAVRTHRVRALADLPAGSDVKVVVTAEVGADGRPDPGNPFFGVDARAPRPGGGPRVLGYASAFDLAEATHRAVVDALAKLAFAGHEADAERRVAVGG